MEKQELIELIEYYQNSLDPQAAEFVEHYEWLLLDIEEREYANIS
jgi:hypothetical protein